MTAQLLKTKEAHWRDVNDVDKLLRLCYNSILEFQHGYNMTDLAVAKSYLDQVYSMYLKKEEKHVS